MPHRNGWYGTVRCLEVRDACIETCTSDNIVVITTASGSSWSRPAAAAARSRNWRWRAAERGGQQLMATGDRRDFEAVDPSSSAENLASVSGKLEWRSGSATSSSILTLSYNRNEKTSVFNPLNRPSLMRPHEAQTARSHDASTSRIYAHAAYKHQPNCWRARRWKG